MDIPWNNPLYGRIDCVLAWHGPPAKGWFWGIPFHHPLDPHIGDLLSAWVPLRELCRHFDGYGYLPGLDETFPVLDLPPNLSKITPFTFTKKHLIDRFLMSKINFQKSHGPFKLPREWEDTMLELYKSVTVEE
jgi:hypothetical protein